MADDTDIKAQVATYTGLIGLMKYGAVAVFVIAFLVIWIIAK